ncbi:MAG: hypothetical protein ACD_79C00090G0017 [uncultured bacterium]|nr:MAG: hypothetical protein ACD_79C00090G0017 [uncultured bacterium]
MDTSDPEITFDEKGVCIHCKRYEQDSKKQLFSNEERSQKLNEIINKIKTDGKNKPYDCVLGISGGVDSTFCAYKAKELGLRPLAVHMDNGWNSKLAVENIEKTLKKLKIDLHTEVLDWCEFKDLQLSFLKASTPDIEIPTDHAIYAVLFQTAINHNVKYIISGYNFKTEAVHPRMWSHGCFDWRYIKNVQKKFGRNKINNFPHVSLFNHYYYIILKDLKIIPILNYMDYQKSESIRILEEKLQWQQYEGKHSESIYTRFVQNYIFPEKFHFDKRRAHLSSLICSGQISREKALEEIQVPLWDYQTKNNELEYVIKKLGINMQEFEQIMNLKTNTFRDYSSYESNLVLILMYKLIQNKITFDNTLRYLQRKLRFK